MTLISGRTIFMLFPLVAIPRIYSPFIAKEIFSNSMNILTANISGTSFTYNKQQFSTSFLL